VQFDPNDFQKMMQEAQKVQEQMKEIQENLVKMRVSDESGGGLVKATVSPKGVAELTIHPTLIEEGPKVIAELVIAAINGAMKKLEETSKKQIAQLTAGIKLPPELSGKIGGEGSDGSKEG